MNLGRRIDHIVYAVPNLEKAMDDFEDMAGIRPVFGGCHTMHGTKNALINLSKGCYLEFLAIDHDNQNNVSNHWMGIDFIQTSQITRWSLKSDDLQKDRGILDSYNSKMGQIISGQRQTSSGNILSWQMTLPLSEPAVELVPFMTDWQHSELHPTDKLPNVCKLINLQLTHPDPETIQKVLEGLRCRIKITKRQEPTIKTQIECPKGLIII